jgi:hypothetical protein
MSELSSQNIWRRPKRSQENALSITAASIVFAGKNKVEIWIIGIPDPGPDEIGVRTLYSGISIGTKLWI